MDVKKVIYLLVLTVVYITPRAQVNLQTGSATFSLPMFNWQDDKSRLNSMVALSYNSGNGLRVNDVASNVGQGWNLVAGGVITRMQVGEPDDQPAYPGNGTEQDIRKYPAGYLYGTELPGKGCPDALRKYPIYESMNQVYTQHNVTTEDKQLDYFSFQFNGKAGMFVLDKPNGDVGVSLGDTKMKISFQRDPTMTNQQIRTTITSFAIQDVDGLIYKFTQHGLTKVLQQGYCDANLVKQQTQPTITEEDIHHQAGFENSSYVNPFVIGSWYLSEIEDALTHRKIFINYEIRNINAVAGADISFYSSEQHYAVITHKTSITTTPVISSIVYPDGHNVTFNYGSYRADLNQDKVLSSVKITYQSRVLSQYVLTTTYFLKNRYGTPVYEHQKNIARLCLKSVKKIGVDLKEDSPPYIFDYYLGSNAPDDFVPPPFFYEKDIWGYYNGNNSVDYFGTVIPANTSLNQLSFRMLQGLCFSNYTVPENVPYLNPKTAYAKNGLLRQIVYPTGGALTYEYSQNTGLLNGSQTTVGGVKVSQTSSTDGGYSNGCGNPVVTHYNYVLGDNTSSLWGLEMPSNKPMQTNNHYEPEWKGWRYSLSNWNLFGECFWHYMYPGILSQQQSVSLTDFQNFMNAAAPYLSILSIISTITDFATVIGSTTVGAIIAVVIDIVCGLVTLGISCFHDYSKDTQAAVYYNFDLNTVSPLPVQFKRVEVVEGNGSSGKTVHEFTNPVDYDLWFPNPDPLYPAKQRFAPWAYGLPRITTILDVDGNKIRQTENEYDWKTTIIDVNQKYNYIGSTNTDLLSCKCVVAKSTSQRNTDWGNPAMYNETYISESNGDVKIAKYAMYSGRAELKRTYERVFNPQDNTKLVETVTEYTYNSNNHYEVTQIKTTQSNGDVNYKNISYSGDFTDGVFTTFNNNNIITLPVSTSTTVVKANENTPLQYLNVKSTEFIQLANGDIKPSKILEQRFAKPLALAWDYTPDNKVTQQLIYDAAGNLVGLKDEGNRTVSNIYDYNDKYIVASVINANPAPDQTGYTSFETTSFGNWTVSTPINYDNTKAITGSRSFVLTQSSLNHTLNTATTYLLSFWGTNNNVSLSGTATLVKSGPTINGFTYYEYNIAAGGNNISLSGNATIDELRLYPKTARMRTTTYDPLIGKTSECDENNRIAYYEYDNLGRLRFIKDEAKNIVKMYEYNNVSPNKQNGCPSAYYNNLITENFTRTNCGTGYLAGTYTYTVPANKYSSTVSQNEADAFAESELLAYGPIAANQNGSCTMLYYNTAQSATNASAGCGVGYYGGSVTYNVPGGKYTSVISQADANQQALIEITANAVAYANDPLHRVCTLTTDPGWTYLENDSTKCQNVTNTPHLFVLETDLNPNSPTYNQKRWKDQGLNDACPVSPDCSFSARPGFGLVTSSMLRSMNSVSFFIVFYSQSGNTNWYLPNQVAQINGSCWPQVNAQLTMNSGGATWEVIIDNLGNISVRLISGNAPTGTTAIGLMGGSYSLN